MSGAPATMGRWTTTKHLRILFEHARVLADALMPPHLAERLRANEWASVERVIRKEVEAGGFRHASNRATLAAPPTNSPPPPATLVAWAKRHDERPPRSAPGLGNPTREILDPRALDAMAAEVAARPRRHARHPRPRSTPPSCAWLGPDAGADALTAEAARRYLYALERFDALERVGRSSSDVRRTARPGSRLDAGGRALRRSFRRAGRTGREATGAMDDPSA